MKELLNHFLNFKYRKLFFLILLSGYLSFFFSIYLFIVFVICLAATMLAALQYPAVTEKRCQLVLKNYSTLLVSLFLTALLFEGYLHLGRPEFLQLKNSTLGELSDFKDRGKFDEKVFNKNEKSFRILGLGDSFAENLTWEGHNYHDFLKNRLMAQGYQNIDIVNAGMAGTGPGYYYHILENLGDSVKPDFVLVGFFVGNDFEEMDFKYRNFGIYGIRQRVDPIARILQQLQLKGWWLYQLARRNYNIWIDRRTKSEEIKQDICTEESSFAEKTFLDIERTRLQIVEKRNKLTFTKSFNSQSNVLLNFKKWCNKRNIKMLLVIFPDEYQVNKKLLIELVQRYGLDVNSLDIDYPNKLVSEFCRNNNINCIDLLPIFQENAMFGDLYRKNDTHWNLAGNKLAAEIIDNYLLDHNLIKQN
ncbi:MAG: hypothetical protein M1438_02420 [Deltaproteobacteria bacterium]|nr:hypothetical protein [Deltaproteobacteria bacterium]